MSDGSEHEKIEREYCTLFISDVYYKRDKRLLTLMMPVGLLLSRRVHFFFYTFSSAWLRSARMSPEVSMPTERRTISGGIPHAACSAAFI